MSEENNKDMFFDNEKDFKIFLEQQEKDTKQKMLKLISNYTPAMLYRISFNVLERVFTEKKLYKTFYKKDGIERTEKEILVEMMYRYDVGTTEHKAYSINSKFWESLNKTKKEILVEKK